MACHYPARPDNPWFDKLTMTLVTLSLSKGGFPDQVGE
jgi:hypothetical protein